MRAEGKGCVMTRRRLEDGGHGRDAGARLGEQGGEQEGEPARSDLGAEAPGGQKVPTGQGRGSSESTGQ